MPDKNAESLGVVYRKSEELFRRLQAEMVVFHEWVVLGSIDLDEYVDEVWHVHFLNVEFIGRTLMFPEAQC